MENVVTLKTLDSSVMSFIILVFILINSHSRSDKMFTDRRLFGRIVILNMFMLVVDYFAWAFNGIGGSLNFALNSAFNCLLYISAPAAPMLWLLYVNYQIYGDEKRLAKITKILLSLLAANAVLSVSSLLTGWYFSVDALNVYHRGPLFIVHVAFNYIIMIYSVISVLKNKRAIEKQYFYSLLLFFIPPVMGTLLQIFVYGLSYNWVGMALSVLIVYFNIQNRSLNTDYLTGAYNRRQLDGYTRSKLKSAAAFSAIMLDLDGLKKINDTMGHDAGDEALKDAVNVIRRAIRENDFVARLGGDEFIVILDIQTMEKLESAKKRIEQSVAAFNKTNRRPYNLSFSYGCRVYDAKSGENLNDFLKHIDSLMYTNKNEKKNKQEDGDPGKS